MAAPCFPACCNGAAEGNRSSPPAVEAKPLGTDPAADTKSLESVEQQAGTLDVAEEVVCPTGLNGTSGLQVQFRSEQTTVARINTQNSHLSTYPFVSETDVLGLQSSETSSPIREKAHIEQSVAEFLDVPQAIDVAVDENKDSDSAPQEDTARKRSRSLTPGSISLVSVTYSSLFTRVGAGPNSVEPGVLRILSFEGEEVLLRGTTLTTVLQGWGRLFANSEGSAATYELSQQVTALDAFISHNWSFPRYKKYLALVVHFNLRIAIVTTILCMLVCGAASVAGYLPTVEVPWNEYRRGVLCKLLCVPIFFLSLVFSRMLAKFVCRLRGPLVFLDKTCIHQVDQDLKRDGIEKLGAFIYSSKTLIVLYTDFYLKRLWTVYEVASFLSLHQGSRINRLKVIPMVRPATILVGLLSTYLVTLVAAALEILVDFGYTYQIALGLLSCFMTLALRQNRRVMADMYASLANFSILDCACACEDDRPVVNGHIACLMRASGVVRSHASDAAALAGFDELMRTTLLKAIAESMGSTALRHEHILVITTFALWPYCLDSLAGLSSGMPLRSACTEVLLYGALACHVLPLQFSLGSWACGFCLHLRGWQERAFLTSVSLIMLVLFSAACTFLNLFIAFAQVSDVGLVAFAMYTSLTSAFTPVAFMSFGTKDSPLQTQP